jgi:hypothetical protein
MLVLNVVLLTKGRIHQEYLATGSLGEYLDGSERISVLIAETEAIKI